MHTANYMFLLYISMHIICTQYIGVYLSVCTLLVDQFFAYNIIVIIYYHMHEKFQGRNVLQFYNLKM